MADVWTAGFGAADAVLAAGFCGGKVEPLSIVAGCICAGVMLLLGFLGLGLTMTGSFCSLGGGGKFGAFCAYDASATRIKAIISGLIFICHYPPWNKVEIGIKQKILKANAIGRIFKMISRFYSAFVP